MVNFLLPQSTNWARITTSSMHLTPQTHHRTLLAVPNQPTITPPLLLVLLSMLPIWKGEAAIIYEEERTTVQGQSQVMPSKQCTIVQHQPHHRDITISALQLPVMKMILVFVLHLEEVCQQVQVLSGWHPGLHPRGSWDDCRMEMQERCPMSELQVQWVQWVIKGMCHSQLKSHLLMWLHPHPCLQGALCIHLLQEEKDSCTGQQHLPQERLCGTALEHFIVLEVDHERVWTVLEKTYPGHANT